MKVNLVRKKRQNKMDKVVSREPSSGSKQHSMYVKWPQVSLLRVVVTDIFPEDDFTYDYSPVLTQCLRRDSSVMFCLMSLFLFVTSR